MCSPAEATHDVTGIAFDRNEGRIERCAPYRVKDNVKPLAGCHLRHIFFNGRRTIIDRDGPAGFRDILFVRRDCREGRGRRAQAGPQRDQRRPRQRE
jgi:hypothetical protein